jgi:uncharacterized protein YggE
MRLATTMTVCMLLAGACAAQQVLTTIPEPSITVSGSGRSLAAPDWAVVRLGASIQSPNAADAQQQVNRIMDETIRQIRELGVPPERIQTVSLSVSPVYQRPSPQREDQPTVIGYRATNIVRVELDDISMAGKIIDAGIASGANQLEGISFELRDDARHRSIAIRQAAHDARTKADAIASAMGVRLAGVIEVSESSGPRPMRAFHSEAVMAGAPVPVQSGQLEVETTLVVRFRIAGAGGEQLN